ncbi:hypothetical protein KM043_018724 [Ampulex compressa]|nr:hypothetical protein KM043_018724 [Ampulex compressa]
MVAQLAYYSKKEDVRNNTVGHRPDNRRWTHYTRNFNLPEYAKRVYPTFHFRTSSKIAQSERGVGFQRICEGLRERKNKRQHTTPRFFSSTALCQSYVVIWGRKIAQEKGEIR